MDPYYAAGVCCGRILICILTVNLHYNVIMKLITSSYNLKFKYKNYLFHNTLIIGVKSF
jgi:hypothetical protein